MPRNDDRFEIILRTNGKISAAQINEVVTYYQNVLRVKETAVPVIGNETEFRIWQQNGGNVKITFTRKTATKFEDYAKKPFAVPYN